MHFAKQKYKFNKNETKSRMENPPPSGSTHTVLERQTLRFILFKNRKLKLKKSQIKIKTVVSWSSRKKKEGIFCTVYFVCFHICVLSKCKVYLILFQNIHTFTYGKTLFHTIFCLFLKSPKTFSVS